MTGQGQNSPKPKDEETRLPDQTPEEGQRESWGNTAVSEARPNTGMSGLRAKLDIFQQFDCHRLALASTVADKLVRFQGFALVSFTG